MDEWINQALLGAITALAGCVGYLYKQTRQHYDYVSKRLKDCEADREDLWHELTGLKKRIDDQERDGVA